MKYSEYKVMLFRILQGTVHALAFKHCCSWKRVAERLLAGKPCPEHDGCKEDHGKVA
jgi:hypothetical protein